VGAQAGGGAEGEGERQADSLPSAEPEPGARARHGA